MIGSVIWSTCMVMWWPWHPHRACREQNRSVQSKGLWFQHTTLRGKRLFPYMNPDSSNTWTIHTFLDPFYLFSEIIHSHGPMTAIFRSLNMKLSLTVHNYIQVQQSLNFTTLYFKTTLDYKTNPCGPKVLLSVLNDLYFKTTCNIRLHFLGPVGFHVFSLLTVFNSFHFMGFHFNSHNQSWTIPYKHALSIPSATGWLILKCKSFGLKCGLLKQVVSHNSGGWFYCSGKILKLAWESIFMELK